jgi:hypothetical protein
VVSLASRQGAVGIRMQGLIGALVNVWWVRLNDAFCAWKWIGKDFFNMDI